MNDLPAVGTGWPVLATGLWLVLIVVAVAALMRRPGKRGAEVDAEVQAQRAAGAAGMKGLMNAS